MRLDVALAQRGLARSRTHAQAMIARGEVQVNGFVATKSARRVEASDDISARAQPWVSRAAHKLLGALADSGTTVPAVVLDAGASTGGFTQVCLERGADRVYAVDVGHGQLAAELATDERVAVREGLNLRDLCLADVGNQPVDLIVGDVSFISLTLLLEPLSRVLSPSGAALVLIKPQFEVGREHLGAGAVVRDEKLREQAVARVVNAAADVGWRCDWSGPSRLPGSSGNLEHFARFRPWRQHRKGGD